MGDLLWRGSPIFLFIAGGKTPAAAYLFCWPRQDLEVVFYADFNAVEQIFNVFTKSGVRIFCFEVSYPSLKAWASGY